MKRMLCLLFLCILLCGCQTQQDPSGVGSGETSNPAGTSGSGNTRSDGTISLLPDPDRPVYENVCFTLPTDWEIREPEQGGELFSARSRDGKQSVSVFITELTLTNGLTQELLLQEARSSLVSAWENAGASGVKADVRNVTFLEQETKALFLSAFSDGEAVFQKQLYRSHDGAVYLVTVTTHGTDETDTLLQAFHVKA